MVNNSTISVVMITYGHERFIKEAINSVLSQNYEGIIELIISNDCSPDNTEEIIFSILNNHDKNSNININYLRPSKNLGIKGNFLWALSHVKTPYVAFCEGDDYWTDTEKLKKQIEVFEQNSYLDLCATNTGFYFQNANSWNRKVIGSKNFPIHLDFKQFIWDRGYMAPCSWMIKTQSLNEILKEFIPALDISYYIYANFLVKSSVHFINEETCVYRILEESASRSKNIFNLITREMDLYETECYLFDKNRSIGIDLYDFSELKRRHIYVLCELILQIKDNLEFDRVIHQIKSNKPDILIEVHRELKRRTKLKFKIREILKKIKRRLKSFIIKEKPIETDL